MQTKQPIRKYGKINKGITITILFFGIMLTSFYQAELKKQVRADVLGTSDIQLPRGFTDEIYNNKNPAIVVNYRPDFIFSMLGKLIKIIPGWKKGN